MVNVTIYSSTMDPMGYIYIAILWYGQHVDITLFGMIILVAHSRVSVNELQLTPCEMTTNLTYPIAYNWGSNPLTNYDEPSRWNTYICIYIYVCVSYVV